MQLAPMQAPSRTHGLTPTRKGVTPAQGFTPIPIPLGRHLLGPGGSSSADAALGMAPPPRLMRSVDTPWPPTSTRTLHRRGCTGALPLPSSSPQGEAPCTKGLGPACGSVAPAPAAEQCGRRVRRGRGWRKRLPRRSSGSAGTALVQPRRRVILKQGQSWYLARLNSGLPRRTLLMHGRGPGSEGTAMAQPHLRRPLTWMIEQARLEGDPLEATSLTATPLTILLQLWGHSLLTQAQGRALFLWGMSALRAQRRPGVQGPCTCAARAPAAPLNTPMFIPPLRHIPLLDQGLGSGERGGSTCAARALAAPLSMRL